MKPAGVYECPKCGFKPLVHDDIPTDEQRKLALMKGEKRALTPSEKQAIWSEIKGYQKERELAGKPLSDGWCAHTYKDYTGVFPRGLNDIPREPGATIRNFIKSKFIRFAKGKAKGASKAEAVNRGQKKGKETKDAISALRTLRHGHNEVRA